MICPQRLGAKRASCGGCAPRAISASAGSACCCSAKPRASSARARWRASAARWTARISLAAFSTRAVSMLLRRYKKATLKMRLKYIMKIVKASILCNRFLRRLIMRSGCAEYPGHRYIIVSNVRPAFLCAAPTQAKPPRPRSPAPQHPARYKPSYCPFLRSVRLQPARLLRRKALAQASTECAAKRRPLFSF